MSEYIVSARKYRPSSFESLIGQDNISQTLKNSIQREKLAHAYLFCGPRGVGKTSTARIFAKTINCEKPTKQMEPCCKCESCISFEQGRSFSIYELDAASNNGVEDIKILMEKVQIPPQIGQYSVYIIDEVHMLSQQAFNAFLKTLEEPPKHAIFILATTEKYKILPTILSRCQTYDFNRISIADIVKNLKIIAKKEKIKAEDEALHIIAQKADGAMRDALTIFDQTVSFCGNNIKYDDVIKNLNVLDYDYSFNLVEAFITANYAEALSIFDNILVKGFNALYFISSLSSHFRDLLVAKNGTIDNLLELPDSLKARYEEQATKLSIQFLYDALSITASTSAGYKLAINPRLHIEYALMKLSFLSGAVVSVKEPKIVIKEDVKPVEKQLEQVDDNQKQVIDKEEVDIKIEPEPNGSTRGNEELSQSSTNGTQNDNKGTSEEQTSEVKKEPKRRSLARNKAVGLTMDTVIEKQNADSGKEGNIDDIIKQEKEITEDDIRNQWMVLAEKYQAQTRLYTYLKTQNLQIKYDEESGWDISSFAFSKSQEDYLNQKIREKLEFALQKSLSVKKLKLNIVLEEKTEEERQKILHPREQAKQLIANNKEVKEFVSDLELDL